MINDYDLNCNLLIPVVSLHFFYFHLQKMNSIIYLSLLALLACSVYGRAIDDPDNAISSETASTEYNEWVKIKPIKIRPHIGNSVELECDVIGSPPPSIHWVRGDKPIDDVSFFISKMTKSPQIEIEHYY